MATLFPRPRNLHCLLSSSVFFSYDESLVEEKATPNARLSLAHLMDVNKVFCLCRSFLVPHGHLVLNLTQKTNRLRVLFMTARQK